MKAEHCLRLDVRDLKRQDVLDRLGYVGWRWSNRDTGEQTGAIGITVESDALRLAFSVNDVPVHQYVPLLRTPCPFGGTRAWLGCPRCYRRVGVLFLRGGSFACRHCGRIVYSSQSDDEIGRAWRRQRKLERLLGPDWSRPKGMHDKTRHEIMAKIWDCENLRDGLLAQFMARRFGLSL